MTGCDRTKATPLNKKHVYLWLPVCHVTPCNVKNVAPTGPELMKEESKCLMLQIAETLVIPGTKYCYYCKVNSLLASCENSSRYLLFVIDVKGRERLAATDTHSLKHMKCSVMTWRKNAEECSERNPVSLHY